MEKKPKVSIIIPVYNVENYICRCMDSVIKQTLQDIEIVVVNDGSSDNSAKIAREYAKKDQRVNLIEKKNGGLSSARNVGMKAASGQVIMFLDSDDYLSLRACETVYSTYKNERADIIVFGANIFPSSPAPPYWYVKKTKTRENCYNTFKPSALIKEAGGSPFAWNKAYSSAFLGRLHVRYNEKVKYGEDLVFCFQVFPAAKKIKFIRDRLYFYRWCRPDSLMNSMSKTRTELLKHHIYNLHIITQYWYKKKWLQKWQISYEIWFLYFLLPDILGVKAVERSCFLKKILKVMQRYKMKSRWIVWLFLKTSNLIKLIDKQDKEKEAE